MTVRCRESIEGRLMEVYAAVERLSEEEILHGPSAGLRAAFDKSDRLAAMEVDDQVVEQIVRDPARAPVLEAIARLRTSYALRLEWECARAVLDGPHPWDTLRRFLFLPNYLQLARTEYDGAGLSGGGRVAFLGSGPLPLSLIVLAKTYAIEGIGIEQVPQYAQLSQRVVERLGLAPRVRILSGNHFSFPLAEDCRLTMVAAAAEPKDEIFRHLAEVLPPQAAVSYRISEKGLRRLLNAQASFQVPAAFRQHRRVRPEPPVNNTVVFLIKSPAGEGI